MSKEYRNEFDTLEIEVEMEREEACRWLSGEFTIFNHITTSPETLAEEFVEPYTRWGEDGYPETLWRSNFRELSGMLFDTKAEALAATLEKLKETKDE